MGKTDPECPVCKRKKPQKPCRDCGRSMCPKCLRDHHACASPVLP